MEGVPYKILKINTTPISYFEFIINHQLEGFDWKGGEGVL